jgi:hypothetical protein
MLNGQQALIVTRRQRMEGSLLSLQISFSVGFGAGESAATLSWALERNSGEWVGLSITDSARVDRCHSVKSTSSLVFFAGDSKFVLVNEKPKTLPIHVPISVRRVNFGLAKRIRLPQL